MKDFSRIQLLILDCDGVLTDGKIIYQEDLTEAKNFCARDGLGVRLLAFTPIRVAVITGRESHLLAKRCQDLHIDLLFQKVQNKLARATELLQELHLDWVNVAYLGDDWNDYPVLRQAAVSAVPADAPADLQDKVDLILTRCGGEGAVREFIEIILREQGIYEDTLAEFLQHLASN